MKENNHLITTLLACFLLSFFVDGASIVIAPQLCPLQDGNLLDVDLFVSTEAECMDQCTNQDNCFFYHFYKGLGNDQQVLGSPSQCFLYEKCHRTVEPAPADCPIEKSNVIDLIPFIKTDNDCAQSCASDQLCSYYKYYSENDEYQPLLCYLLQSCVPRLIKRMECPLEESNYIDHKLFVQSDQDCLTMCEESAECRFYSWYPIDYSPKPLYCYLFRSCQHSGQESLSAFISGGRHPGQYFRNGGDSIDLLQDNMVCNAAVTGNSSWFLRGGAVSDFIVDSVLVCGGTDTSGLVRDDCIAYSTQENSWYQHSILLGPREEAATVVVTDSMYILGGIIEGEIGTSVEVWNSREEQPQTGQWKIGPDLPEARARFCAVVYLESSQGFGEFYFPADEQKLIAIIGGEDSNGSVMNSMETLDTTNEQWTVETPLKTARKDHACALLSLDDETGILVTGGVGEDNKPLDSVEFYSFSLQDWITLGPMKEARTEHGLAVVNGLPTAIGGLSATEFLVSIEQLDSSKDTDAPYAREWRIVSQCLSAPRYDFALAHIPTRMVSTKICNVENKPK